MTSSPSLSGALEAVERILNRGGEPDDVLGAVVGALHERGIPLASIRFVDGDELAEGPSAGGGEGRREPVVFHGRRVAELELAVDDEQFVRRVAILISAHCAREP
jgi:hypothetical protein